MGTRSTASPVTTMENGRFSAGTMEEFEKLVSCLAVPSKISCSAVALVRSFVDSAMHYSCGGVEIDQEALKLRLRLRTCLEGEVATRSRIGMSVRLGGVNSESPALSISVEQDGDKLRVLVEHRCLQMGPVEAAADIWNGIHQMWADKGIGEIDQKLRSAWHWWERHNESFVGTKAWKVMTSLSGMRSAAAVMAKKDLAVVLLGSICVGHMAFEAFTLSLCKDGSVQLSCSRRLDSGVHQEGHPYYDPHIEEKMKWVEYLMKDTLESSTRLSMALKFAPSATAFGLMCEDAVDVGLTKRADPKVIVRLFSQCNKPGASLESSAVCGLTAEVSGGATFKDLGAQAWQKEDITFAATGKYEGRMFWRPTCNLPSSEKPVCPPQEETPTTVRLPKEGPLKFHPNIVVISVLFVSLILHFLLAHEHV